MTELIMSQSKGGERESIEVVYERHVNMLYRVCFSYMKSESEAEDVVADVFVKLLRHGRGFQNAEHEKAWLLRTAINLCKDRLKHWWRRREDIDQHQGIKSTDTVEDETLKAVMELPKRYFHPNQCLKRNYVGHRVLIYLHLPRQLSELLPLLESQKYQILVLHHILAQ